MIGIVLVAHGLLADGLKHAVEMIVGPQERLVAIGMEPGSDGERLRRRIEDVVGQMLPAGEVLVLTDLLGGSPANASFALMNNGTPVLCGVNLPMLLEILTQRAHTPLPELTRLAVQAAKEGIIHLRPLEKLE
ncbi:PTS sugar transporter subunit IIA [Tengunoibacter tsumagoiensis]|uniref:PTS fructose transporter subunit IIA n=1 Tax=Tengunoibacter tsumagoiensis TaxID=2014871 RepID=A0A402A334_9CHLR|nr:PTS sugar transporter subunit IIA [Tengunoibacter tsumagoiensis]GCE13560.1 PTS fructose transporter subunit IIA [Tengunoibacter tsumagoiensis]